MRRVMGATVLRAETAETRAFEPTRSRPHRGLLGWARSGLGGSPNGRSHRLPWSRRPLLGRRRASPEREGQRGAGARFRVGRRAGLPLQPRRRARRVHRAQNPDLQPGRALQPPRGRLEPLAAAQRRAGAGRYGPRRVLRAGLPARRQRTSRIQLSDPGARLALLGLDPAETRAVFKNTPTNSLYGSLHVVPLDGSAASIRLGGSLTARDAWFAPDGIRVLFAAPDPRRELLYVVAADGSGSPVLLDATPPAPIFTTHYLAFDDLVFTLAGDRAVYHHAVDTDDGDWERTLNSVPLDASLPAAEIPEYINRSSDLENDNFVLDTSSPPRVGYGGLSTRIHSSLLDGTGALTLSPSEWSVRSWPEARGTQLFFSAFRFASGGHTIFRVPSDGSLPAAALFAAVPGPINDSFALTPSQSLAFITSGTVHVVDQAGGTPLPLHPAPPAGQAALELLPHPDGSRLLFRGDLEVDNRADLYLVPLDGSATPVRLNDAFPGGSVFEFRLSPDGTRVAYKSFASGSGDLRVVPLDRSTGPVQIDEVRPGAVVGDVTHV